MSKLELILLGRFECLLPTGTRISLPMRKAEVLLAFLALSPGLRHPRERLINLLWSDRGEAQARNSLRQCLSAIRKALGEAADLVLLIDRTTVSLQAEMIEVDAIEFERLALAGDFESLTTAAKLYQGEFLEGISIRDAACQEWLDGERGTSSASSSKSCRTLPRRSSSATTSPTRSARPSTWSSRIRSASTAGAC